MKENLREFALKHLPDYFELLRLRSISAQQRERSPRRRRIW